MRLLTLFSLTLALVLLSLGASAATDAGTVTSSRERATKVVEARASFERGLKLFDEGSYTAARDAFQHAHDLAPSYRLLYNIGLAAKELGDYAGAIRLLEGYLTDGTWEITPERGAEVAALIGGLMHQVGSNRITTNVAGAQVFVDGIFAGQTPLEEPVVVNPGKHTIEVRAKGYPPASRSITAVSGETGEDLHFDLTPPTTAPSMGLVLAVSAAVFVGLVVVFRLRRRAGSPASSEASAPAAPGTKDSAAD